MNIIEVIFTLADETTTQEQRKQLIESLTNDEVCTILNLYSAFTELDDTDWRLLDEAHSKFTR